MIATTRTQNRYDHRLRDLVRSTGSIEHALRRGVPRSTARGWLSATRTAVVTLDVVEGDLLTLQQEVLQMRRRVERLVTLLRLFVVLLKVSGFSLAHARISEGTGSWCHSCRTTFQLRPGQHVGHVGSHLPGIDVGALSHLRRRVAQLLPHRLQRNWAKASPAARRDRGWTVEVAFPWKGMEVLARADNRSLPPDDGDTWRIDFSRFNQYKEAPPAEDSGGWAWSTHRIWDSHVPECFPYIHFSKRDVIAAGKKE